MINEPDFLDLPEAEQEVMACLWRLGKATARQIREEMKNFRPMAHGSTVTLLNRLEGKGLVAREKSDQGKAFVYRPLKKASPAYRHVVGKVLQRIFGGDSLTLVSSLFKTKPPTAEEIADLQQLLDGLRQQNKDKES